MLLGILQDRFGLRSHLDTREQRVYELSVLTDGSKLRPTPQPASLDGEPPNKPQMHWAIHNGKLTASAMTMDVMAENLSYQFKRTVVDKTGITGTYDFTLSWTSEDQAGGQDSGANANPSPNIFTALKEQLGLKLMLTKSSVITVVVDKLNPPEAN